MELEKYLDKAVKVVVSGFRGRLTRGRVLIVRHIMEDGRGIICHGDWQGCESYVIHTNTIESIEEVMDPRRLRVLGHYAGLLVAMNSTTDMDKYGDALYKAAEYKVAHNINLDEHVIISKQLKTKAGRLRILVNWVGVHYAGHRRSMLEIYGGDSYWAYQDYVRIGGVVTISDWIDNLWPLLKRYQRFYHYVTEVAPQWAIVGHRYYADNSVEALEEDKDGNTRNRMTTAPHGDACY